MPSILYLVHGITKAKITALSYTNTSSSSITPITEIIVGFNAFAKILGKVHKMNGHRAKLLNRYTEDQNVWSLSWYFSSEMKVSMMMWPLYIDWSKLLHWHTSYLKWYGKPLHLFFWETRVIFNNHWINVFEQNDINWTSSDKFC